MAYSTRVYSTVEGDLDAGLDGILSKYLREAEVRGEDIDPMTAELGGRGDRRQQQVKRGRRERLSSLEEEEEEGVEVTSKIDFRDPKLTLTSNLYWPKN